MDFEPPHSEPVTLDESAVPNGDLLRATYAPIVDEPVAMLHAEDVEVADEDEADAPHHEATHAHVETAEPEPDFALRQSEQFPSIEDAEPLMSSAAGASITSSFQALAESVMLQDPGMVERLTRESLRPMLKAWLDDHLPSIVERLVRAEIERVARGGRSRD